MVFLPSPTRPVTVKSAWEQLQTHERARRFASDLPIVLTACVTCARTSEKRCWTTVARASTLLFPCTSSLLSWLMAWFFLSTCSLLWVGFTGGVPSATTDPDTPGLEAFCRRGPGLGPVLPLNPALGAPGPIPELALEGRGAGGTGGTGGTGVLQFTTSGAWKQETAG